MILDDIEDFLWAAHQFTISQREALKAVLGLALLFHGNELLGVILDYDILFTISC